MKNNAKNTDRKGTFRYLSMLFLYFLVMLLFFCAKDFVKEIINHDSTYEIRYEAIEELSNGQKIYQLYKNGEYYYDVDINEFTLLDEDGNGDLWYCALIRSANRLTYAIIFAGMLYFVVRILNDMDTTPFTIKNTKRIKAIAFLQLCLSIIPELVTFVMKMIKFNYIHSAFSITSLYNIMIYGVIVIIAKVFERGVMLQQENDLIA